MAKFQEMVAKEYEECGYTKDLLTLGLGLAEEVGEVCAAINDMNEKYIPRKGRCKSDLRHELHDCLTYLCAIANSVGIELGI